MVVPALALGLIVVVLLGALLVWRRSSASAERSSQPTVAGNGGVPAGSAARTTALDELRDLRDALKPAEHSRVERRRPGGAGTGPYLGLERRRPRAKK